SGMVLVPSGGSGVGGWGSGLPVELGQVVAGGDLDGGGGDDGRDPDLGSGRDGDRGSRGPLAGSALAGDAHLAEAGLRDVGDDAGGSADEALGAEVRRSLATLEPAGQRRRAPGREHAGCEPDDDGEPRRVDEGEGDVTAEAEGPEEAGDA